MLLETVTPLTMEVALTVQQELQARLEEADRLRRQHVERARYEADLARRRYLQVDPEQPARGRRIGSRSGIARCSRSSTAQETYDRHDKPTA